jgi:hypothetical protein
MLFVASAQDKTNPSGSTALGTTAANAGKVWLITSQRDLVDTFGTPKFYTDASNNPRHGDELNEYGLQAAYSMLGVSSRAYVVRADLDTAQLAPTSTAPTGDPVAGTFWVDSDASLFGIKEWSSSTQRFTVKTPIVLDDNTPSASFSSGTPVASVGSKGDYAIDIRKDYGYVWFKNTSNTWTSVTNGFDSGKSVQISPHFTYPSTFDASTATGSVWITTTSPSNGAKWSVKYYNGSSQTWTTVNAPIYNGNKEAIYALDSAGGGKNIPLRSVYIDSDPNNSNTSTQARFILKQRNATGTTSGTGAATTALTTLPSYTFVMKASVVGSSNWATSNTITITPANTATLIASLIPAAVSSAGLTNVSASFDSTTNKLTITHAAGGK